MSPIHRLLLALSVGALVSTGCVPEKRVKWSPDGGVAAVRIGSDLHLCDPNGVLSPSLVGHVADMEWIAGTRRLVLVRALPTGKWADLEPSLAPARRVDLLRRAPELRDAIIAHKGNWDDFNANVLDGLRDEDRAAVLVLVKERYAEELSKQAADAWTKLGAFEAPIYSIQLAQTDGLEQLTLGDVTLRGLAPLARPTPSPDGRAVAFVRALPELKSELLVAALRSGAEAKRVAESITGTFAWMPDGKQLVYATAANSDVSGSDPMLIAVQRAAVVGADGEVLNELSDGTRLAFALVDGEPSVAAAADGSVVFAALDASLPVAAPDLVRSNALHVVAPGDQILCSRLTPKRLEGELPKILALFSISPDGQHCAIADPDGGRLLIYAPKTGTVWTAVSADDAKGVRIWPTWRSNDELTYAVLRDENDLRSVWDLVCVKLDFGACTATRTVLSAGWPNIENCDFLIERKGEQPALRVSHPASQPASQPAAP